MDLVLINPGGRSLTYQKLACGLAGIEPPLWTGLLASFARTRGISVAVVDADAEGLDPEQTAGRVAELDPLLAVVVAFGANPSASTQKMTVAGASCSALAEAAPTVKRALAGLHPSALPARTIREEDVDFVIEGEGPYTLAALVAALRAGGGGLDRVPGLWYRDGNEIAHTPRAPLVADLDVDLPGVAWDLLPMDRYRAHNWHCFDDVARRSPYAVIYTSLGCPFTCSFCCINALFGRPGIRYRSPESVLDEIDLLDRPAGRAVRRPPHQGHRRVVRAEARPGRADLRSAYRAGLRPELLGLRPRRHRRAGSARQDEAGGVQLAGLRVRVGLAARPRRRGQAVHRRSDGRGDRLDPPGGHPHHRQLHLRPAGRRPGHHGRDAGDGLYERALAEGWALPESWHQYAQFGEDTLPLPTKHLSAGEVLRFRDRAFVDYFSDERYQRMIRETFGEEALDHIGRMLEHKMVRKFAPPPGEGA